MKLTLRSARKLETKITKYLDETPVNTGAKVRVNANVDEVIVSLDSAQKKAKEEIADRVTLVEIKYAIRQKIASANHEAGINALITEKVQCEQKVNQIKAIVATTPRLSKEELTDTLRLGQTKLSNGSPGRYGEDAAVSTTLSVFTEAELDSYKKDRSVAAKRIEAIEDLLTELNASTKVEVDEASVKVLQKYDLV
jgi:hypothetical protein